MRYLLIILMACLAGCKAGPAKKSVHDSMTGNWFVVYPELEPPATAAEEKLYAEVQDSLVNGKGLKLISCRKNGEFIQWDSTGMKGKWAVMNEKTVVVREGGKGFDNFKAEFSTTDDGKIKLTEYLNINGQPIDISWYLFKAEDDKAATLFDPENNKWRSKPAGAEEEKTMKKRLSAMLRYYSVYFKLIADQSSYFMPVRVMLPLKFYQHAIGMKDLDEKHRFVSLFYSPDDAKKAYGLLKEVVNNSDYNFPEGENKSYSIEYSYMLAQLAEEILK